MWLAIRHPDLLETPAARSLVLQAADDVSAFHQVIHATVLMVGHGPLTAAIAQSGTPPGLRSDLDAFVEAVAATEPDDADPSADPYDDMHATLEQLLDDGPDLAGRVRYLLMVTGLAARLTDSDANPHRTEKDHISTPGELIRYLIAEPSMYAAATLHRHDEETAIRASMLALTAQVASTAAGELAAEFPDLDGDDPRLDPAARTRARQWVETALRLANEQGRPDAINDLSASADARELAASVVAESDLPEGWAVQRFVAAAAEAAASILHAIDATGLALGVFSV